jgi:hypothetical protein
VVKNGKVTEEIIYVSAIDEIAHTIAQANIRTHGLHFITLIVDFLGKDHNISIWM